MVRTLLVGLIFQASTCCFACGEYGNLLFPTQAADELRAEGSKGLKVLLDAYDKEQFGDLKSSQGYLERLRNKIDQVAAQRHAHISRLYWYTDLEKAKAAAANTGKPILSLRMLGKLTDEFSCANSRFFRTALYANESISKVMRENFVLHWQSVRPAPKVTIDFGDGRKLERTVTGNSAHYVLDTAGRPLDVLPGLYSPKEFQAWLERVGKWTAARNRSKHSMSYASAVTLYHQHQHQQLLQRWQSDLRQAGLESNLKKNLFSVSQSASTGKFPAANKAAKITIAKGRAERPVMTVMGYTPDQLESKLDNLAWQKIATLHRDDTKLDQQTVNLMREENPNAFRAGALASTKSIVEDPLLRVVRNFEDSISLDTVRNEYLLHRQVHQWFIDGSAITDVESLNERVYAELFLTPSSDPWLGLAPADRYTALNHGGLKGARALNSGFYEVQPGSRIETKPVHRDQTSATAERR